MTTGARPYRAPDGPRWVPGAKRGATQVDGRGKEWLIVKVEQGGRVIHWRCVDWEECMAAGTSMGRQATTTITPADSRYPSDAAVIEWQREQRRAAAHPVYY